MPPRRERSVERPPSVLRGWLLTGAGVLLLLFTADVLDEATWDFVWPALIVFVGVLVVARWAGRAIPSGASREDVIRATAVFGGPGRRVCATEVERHTARRSRSARRPGSARPC